MLVIGDNSTQAETALLTAKDGNRLTVVRGFQSAARAWVSGTTIARNFAAYDHDTFIDNITTLEGMQTAHELDELPHILYDEHENMYKWGFRVDTDGSLVFMYEEAD